MDNSYTSLQREQLAKQTYTDTQSTYLLVYAPLRSRVLAQALQDQLHRKFRLVDHLAGELTDARWPVCSSSARTLPASPPP